MIHQEKVHRLDLEEFNRLYNLHFESICLFLMYYSNNRDLIQDIVQEIFLSVWENRATIDLERGVKTYLFRMARNRILNELKQESNRHQLLEKWYKYQLEVDHVSDLESFQSNSIYETLQALIHQLPEKCREIFILCKQQNFTYREIGEAKNISIKTVENQMGLALKRIREGLKEKVEELRNK